ncbi:sigma-70 family RNA polymerase sigma factor [Hyphococcus formosus]|uniref:sigma-70 family RNA polymerase sigma factor n=1 Tax=Hyphococcus formosus TaxID=3143534 RepID=UPI00398AB5B4
MTPNDEIFERHRTFLFGVAYRMLGSVAEAEDIVQDSYLRWRKSQNVENPRVYLSRIVSRLCLDRLKQARTKREIYIGPWLPEPILNRPDLVTEEPAILAKDISYALMLALERLSPLERAAFLLHDVFDDDYNEIAKVLDRSEASCRQLATRARNQIRRDRPRFTVEPERSREIANAFFDAMRNGDTDALSAVLAKDAVLHTDGGGKVSSALNIIHSAEKIVRFYAGLARKNGDQRSLLLHRTSINGMPGEVVRATDGVLQTNAVEIIDGKITVIYITRNPDKLRHLAYLDTAH